MNVFYTGVDNPVEISVAGVAPNKISADATNGSLVPSAGNYIMRPKRPGNSLITVYAELDGKKRAVGSKEFRVKPVPDPYATIGGKKGGGIYKNELIAQTGVAAVMPPDFEFDLTFTVTEFTVFRLCRDCKTIYLQKQPFYRGTKKSDQYIVQRIAYLYSGY
jgi:hypothetical protein